MTDATVRVLVVDDEKNYLLALDALLAESGYEVVTTSNPLEAQKRVEDETFDCLITDLKMPRMSGLELLRACKQADPSLPVLILTAYGTVETAVAAMREGAYHYVLKPFNNEELKLSVSKAVELGRLRRDKDYLRESIRSLTGFGSFVGRSEPMRRVFELIEQVAPGRTTVLITGESGTGKELAARAIHQKSPRADRSFVAVNCCALTETLLESELFGHERGAFTGAQQRRRGRFELAHGGTLFLDEIAETTPALQAKLLRAVQEGQFERVGGEHAIQVDVRIIAATNKDLAEAVREGSFREDLYYRLNVVPIALPPLRERRDDIPLLAEHFLGRHALELKKDVTGFAPEALADLVRYRWPGNVRELENVIERAVVLCRGAEVGQADLPRDMAEGSASVTDEILRTIPPGFDLQRTLDEIEKRLLVQALREHNFVQARAAASLGISRSHMQYKLKKHGLEAGGPAKE